MPIVFRDAQEIMFEYHDQIPNKTINLRIKNESAYRLNLTALHLYGLYRNTIHDSYTEKQDLAEDILQHTHTYEDRIYPKSPLYHYSVECSLGTMKEWRESSGKIKCYMAYQNMRGIQKILGFVHFTEQILNHKNIVYIAEAGVLTRGHGIGRYLMECVLTHFPAGTEFYILTRLFNTNAKTLYQKKLGFTSISEEKIQQLGYDHRYCGFHHVSTQEEIAAIQDKKITTDATTHANLTPQLGSL